MSEYYNGHILKEYEPGSAIYLCINCGKGERELEESCTNQRPFLTKEQIKDGFHIWTEFTELITTPEKTEPGSVPGYVLTHKDGKQLFDHWKKCPCNRDLRLK